MSLPLYSTFFDAFLALVTFFVAFAAVGAGVAAVLFQ
jgi:hypothetical protein